MEFKELNLCKNVLQAVEELGYTKATEIQEKAIPILMEGRVDFIGQAQTGTGKTAAFVIPLLEKLDENKKNVQALILTPTRELANQIQEEIRKLSKFTKMRSLAVYGGAPYDKQIRGLKKDQPQIVVGTPGRVQDMINKNLLKLGEAAYLVLDEADEMLNMGFHEAVEEILTSFNDERRLWMFSATMPAAIKKMIDREFQNPVTVVTKKKEMANADIEQSYYIVRPRYKREALKRIIDMEDEVYGIIFCRTKADTKETADDLVARGHVVETLHGDMGQDQRDASMARFKAKKVRLLVCTDVAARGIDCSNLTHVFNYGFPQDFESYVHRIGRTGRAGNKGKAVIIIDHRDAGKVKRLARHIKADIKEQKLPTPADLKKSIVSKRLKSMDVISEAVASKGESFDIDTTFSTFSDYFNELTKEQVLKVIFTNILHKDLRRIDDIGSLEDNFQKSDSPRASRNGRRGEREVRTGRSDRHSGVRGDRPQRFDRREKGEQGRRSVRASENGSTRFFMNMGKDDGLNLKTLLNDISKLTGLRANHINRVDMKGRFSFLEVPSSASDKLLKAKDFRIDNKSVHFEVSN